MGFWPVSIFFEFVVLIGVPFILLLLEGVLPRAIASFLFPSGIAVAVGKQLWVVENPPGTLNVVTLAPFPTIYVTILIWLHLTLGYFAIAKTFQALGRDPLGRKQNTT